MLLQSRLEKSKKFKNWITKTVLPSIRKYGYYEQKKEHELYISEITKKLNYIEKENEKLKKDLKVEKYPKGSLVYKMDYSDEEENMYRLGKSDDMENRKKIYDTHTIHKKEVIIMKEVKCPLQFETCLRAMLYGFRIKNKKDFYQCDIKKIEKAFEECEKSIKCVNQTGGGFKKINQSVDNWLNKEIVKLTKEKDMKKIELGKYKRELTEIKNLFV